jgi:hypothetical protein
VDAPVDPVKSTGRSAFETGLADLSEEALQRDVVSLLGSKKMY